MFQSYTNKDVERLEISLTNHCNLNCVLCQRNYSKQKLNNTFIDTEKLLQKITNYPNLKYITIAGAVGEPTLHPDFFKILTNLSKNYKLEIYINCETHNDLFYKKLKLLLNDNIKLIISIFGSTNEIHSKYRKGSKLENILRRYEILKSKNIEVNWIIFNYNYEDYMKNKNFYKFNNIKVFNTLPVKEFFDLDTNIHLIDNLHYSYLKNINKKDKPKTCKSITNKFRYIDENCSEYLCSLQKIYNYEKCFECSSDNLCFLNKNNINTISESETTEQENVYK